MKKPSFCGFEVKLSLSYTSANVIYEWYLNKFAKNAFVGNETLHSSVLVGFKLAIKIPVFITTRKHVAH